MNCNVALLFTQFCNTQSHFEQHLSPEQTHHFSRILFIYQLNKFDGVSLF